MPKISVERENINVSVSEITIYLGELFFRWVLLKIVYEKFKFL